MASSARAAGVRRLAVLRRASARKLSYPHVPLVVTYHVNERRSVVSAPFGFRR